MKKFLLSLLIILACVFVLDRVLGCLFAEVGKYSNDTRRTQLNYVADKIEDDVVLFGTSRCYCHYVPTIIQDTLGMSVYNAGIDASYCIYAHYIVLNLLLERHIPKVVCIDMDYHDFDDGGTGAGFSEIMILSPFYGHNPAIDSLFNLSGRGILFDISRLYQYNPAGPRSLVACFYNKPCIIETKGYYPRYVSMPISEPEKVTKYTPTDYLKLEYIQKTIDLCRKHNIRLVFSHSPKNVLYNKKVDCYMAFDSLRSANNIPLIDDFELFVKNPECFSDNAHLNDYGAKEFSKIFARQLKEVLDK